MSSKINNYSKKYMKIAIDMAKVKIGLTGVNPSVGCVIVKNNKIISIGKTGINGVPHAEADAIKNTTESLYNSDLFVSLEPCSHYGKTPPCTSNIIKKKIKRIFYGMDDVDLRSKNKSYEILKKKNIHVKKNLLNSKCKKIYRSYIHLKNTKLPFITAKIACSKNYVITSNKKYITNHHSLNVSHLLRYKSHAILVSHKTINTDNPLLNCRINGLEKFSPIRIILDKNLKLKLSSNIFKTAKKYKTIIFYNKENNKIKRFKENKIKLIKLQLNENGMFDLKKVLNVIKKLNIHYVLLEGGKKLTLNFLKEKLVNEFFLFKTNTEINYKNNVKINNIISILNKNFKKKNIKTYLANDRLVKYY